MLSMENNTLEKLFFTSLAALYIQKQLFLSLSTGSGLNGLKGLKKIRSQQ